jgi:hypothetical protein
MSDFKDGVVGAKSKNLANLRGKLPDWIKLPPAVTVPFSSFEQVGVDTVVLVCESGVDWTCLWGVGCVCTCTPLTSSHWNNLQPPPLPESYHCRLCHTCITLRYATQEASQQNPAHCNSRTMLPLTADTSVRAPCVYPTPTHHGDSCSVN